MRVALVHDYLVQLGGAERVLNAFREIWPDAPIYTSVYDRKSTEGVFDSADIRCSSLQAIYGSAKRYKFAITQFAGAFEEFDFSSYDLVLSSSSAYAKGIVTGPKTCHVCYCHTPSRLAWQFHSYILDAGYGRFATSLLRRQAKMLRTWDVTSASRVDHFIANSHNVAKRIKKYYNRDSSVVHAPVDCARFSPSEKQDEGFYLLVGRMIPYKRMDLAVEAFTKMGRRLVVVGSGPHEKKLRTMAGPTIEFLGRVPDSEVASLYSRCKAFLFTGEEDFGIAPLEAMASGRPVIAYRAGGALETIVDGGTGVFFDSKDCDALISSVERFETLKFSSSILRKHAERFDNDVFKSKISLSVRNAYQSYNSIPSAPASLALVETGSVIAQDSQALQL